jgi:iron(III) transport system substrate-binding protein
MRSPMSRPSSSITGQASRSIRRPQTRGELIDYLEREHDRIFGRIGTYDIERSGVGFMFFARDQEQFGDIWRLVGAMGAAGVKLYSTTSAIVERVADGRFVFGYNILGSYAAEVCSEEPEPRDQSCRRTTRSSRHASGSCRARRRTPTSGVRSWPSSCRAEGQSIMARKLQIASLHPGVTGENTANAMQETLGEQLRPVPGQPGTHGLSRPGEAGADHRAVERDVALAVIYGRRQVGDSLACSHGPRSSRIKTANL